MKAFEHNGEVSRDHHYLLFRNVSTGEEVHFAVPKCVRLIDAINALKPLMPEPWRFFDLDDRFYGGSEPPELIADWSRSFLTDMAVHASTLGGPV